MEENKGYIGEPDKAMVEAFMETTSRYFDVYKNADIKDFAFSMFVHLQDVKEELEHQRRMTWTVCAATVVLAILLLRA
jgi:hypothetical protein